MIGGGGGYKDIDIEPKIKSMKIRIRWAKRLCENEKRPWKLLATYRLKAISGTSVFHSI